MSPLRVAVLASVLWLHSSFSILRAADEATPPKFKTERLIYKAEPRRMVNVSFPDDWKETDSRPALIIFRCNIPVQREHFRSLGMVIFEPELANVNHGLIPAASLKEIAAMPKPRNQVEDTKSAIRFVRQNAKTFGTNPKQIVATGTSGGGDLALQSYLNRTFEDPNDDLTVSPRPNALILYCPAFDGINIWFVRAETIRKRTATEAPSFLSLLKMFVRLPETPDGLKSEFASDDFAVPLDHRANLIKRAETLGKQEGFREEEIKAFQAILLLFNKSDWQLLQSIEDEKKMCASRLLNDEPFPPTLIMFGDSDHLFEHQTAFVNKAKAAGKQFDLKIYENGGHSFMMEPPLRESSTQEAQKFLEKIEFLPKDSTK